MAAPKITVIITAFNQTRYLERAICSVLDQDHGNVELIVVDRGSTDGSDKLISFYEADLAHWLVEANCGEARAINFGVEHASGDIVTILGARDVLLPGALSAVAARMSQPGAPRWLLGQSVKLSDNDMPIGHVTPACPTSVASYLMHDSGLIPFTGTFIHKHAISRAGLFNVAFEHAFGFEYWTRLLTLGFFPAVMTDQTAAVRDSDKPRTAEQTLLEGLEHIAIAEHYGQKLPLAQRYALWANCDHRRRIFALAEAETYDRAAQRFLVLKVLAHPWWLSSTSMRRALIFGIGHPARPHAA
jgi:glycosyltransferase involved in cell wall biosynthesis